MTYHEGIGTFDVIQLIHFSLYLIYGQLIHAEQIASATSTDTERTVRGTISTGDQIAFLIISSFMIILSISSESMIMIFKLKEKNK